MPAVVGLLSLAGCAGPTEDRGDAGDPGATQSSPPSDEAGSSSAPEESPSAKSKEASKEPEEPAGPSLEVSVEGDQVLPNAAELSARTGEPIALTITASRAGELHVHSKPEQYVEFRAGSTSQQLVITTPGTVEIEEHETEAVVAVVEVTQ